MNSYHPKAIKRYSSTKTERDREVKSVRLEAGAVGSNPAL